MWLLSTQEFHAGSPRIAASTNLDQNPWRRTDAGWERISDWKIDNHHRPLAARIHPGLVASFMVLAAVGTLVAFSPATRPEPAG